MEGKILIHVLSERALRIGWKKSGRKTFAGDPGVEGFSHPEDFYEWYRDDFYDYEDAEDYYYEHGG